MIIVGLGNPGSKYDKTRHNVGFMFVDSIASSNNLTFKLDKTFEAFIAEYIYKGEKHFLVKPTTYMNNSGQSVIKILNYYKKGETFNPNDLLVIYDDMDLPTGKMRIRKNGSSGGHNGMKSIINHLATEDFKRIRIGIDKPQNDTIDYVLGRFSKSEEKLIQETIVKAPNIIDDLINYGFDYVMNNYNKNV